MHTSHFRFAAKSVVAALALAASLAAVAPAAQAQRLGGPGATTLHAQCCRWQEAPWRRRSVERHLRGRVRLPLHRSRVAAARAQRRHRQTAPPGHRRSRTSRGEHPPRCELTRLSDTARPATNSRGGGPICVAERHRKIRRKILQKKCGTFRAGPLLAVERSPPEVATTDRNPS